MFKKSPHNIAPSEWSHIVRADHVPDKGRHVKIKANPDECAAMAERLGVDSVERAQAEMLLKLQNGGHILHVSGRFQADVTQSCVASNKPVPAHLEEDFEAWYADHDKAIPFQRVKHDVQLKTDGEEVQMLEEHEDPEPMVDGQVDVGDLVVQYMCLAVNPYPRHPSHKEDEAAPSQTLKQAEGRNLRPNPFAALKNWRPKD